MVIGLNSGEAKMADLKALLRNLDSLKKRAKGKSNPILDKRMRELLKKIEDAKAGPGDAIRKRSPHDLMLKKKKKKSDPLGSWKVKDEDEEEIDWEKETKKRSKQTAEEMYGLGGSDTPGDFMPYDLPFKKGGRIKKPKKKTKKRKRAALRGYRAELRGG